LKYHPPYGSLLRPLASLVHDGINWLLGLDDASATRAHVARVAPRAVVAESLVRALEASGRFEEVRALNREPVEQDRRRADAIVRVASCGSGRAIRPWCRPSPMSRGR
jgi:hypothetical protein